MLQDLGVVGGTTQEYAVQNEREAKKKLKFYKCTFFQSLTGCVACGPPWPMLNRWAESETRAILSIAE